MWSEGHNADTSRDAELRFVKKKGLTPTIMAIN